MHICVMMPLMQSIFWFGMGLLRNNFSVTKGFDYWKTNIERGLNASIRFWPPILVGLYTFVPVRFGNLYMDSLNFLYAIILSYLVNVHKEEAEEAGLIKQPVEQTKKKIESFVA
jgi:hypothetical protein